MYFTEEICIFIAYSVHSLGLSPVENITLKKKNFHSTSHPTLGPWQRLCQTQEDTRENRVWEQHRRTSRGIGGRTHRAQSTSFHVTWRHDGWVQRWWRLVWLGLRVCINTKSTSYNLSLIFHVLLGKKSVYSLFFFFHVL